MNTYRIRVHNGYYFILVILPAVLIPLFFVFHLPGRISLDDYMIIHGFRNLSNYFACYFILYISGVVTIFYYSIYDFIDVKISSEGISTKWQKGCSFSKKVEREIRWDEIEKVDYLLTANWWNGIKITTNDKEKFSFASLSLLFRQKNYKAFLKDFQSRYSATKNKQSC